MARARRLGGAIGEDVAEMCVAIGAADLRSGHEWDRSVCALTAPSATGAQKLGQPVPDSNLVSEENSGAPQQTQA